MRDGSYCFPFITPSAEYSCQDFVQKGEGRLYSLSRNCVSNEAFIERARCKARALMTK